MSNGSVLTPEGEIEVDEEEIDELLESQRSGLVDKVPLSGLFGEDSYVEGGRIEDGSTVVGDVQLDLEGVQEVRNLENVTVMGEELKFVGRPYQGFHGLESSELSFDRIYAHKVPVFWNAEDTSIEFGTLEAKSALKHAVNARFEGDKAEIYDLAADAERSVVSFDHLSAKRGLKSAENTVALTDTLRTSESHKVRVGEDSSGSVLAARNILNNKENWKQSITRSKAVSSLKSQRFEEKFSDDLTVFTQDGNVENTKVYRGDWNELESYLLEEVPNGGFEPLDLFEISSEFDSLEGLRSEVDEVKTLYEDVKDDFQMYTGLRDEFGLEGLEGGNRDVYERLIEFDAVKTNVAEAVKDPEEDSYLVSLQNMDEKIQYHGDWESLKSNVKEFSKEDMEALELFDIDEEVSTADELVGQLDHVNELFNEVDEAYRGFQSTKSVDVDPGDTNDEKYEFLRKREFYSRMLDNEGLGGISVDVISNSQETIISFDKHGDMGYTRETRISGSAERIEEWLEDLDAEQVKALDIFDLPQNLDSIQDLDEAFDDLEQDYRDVESAAETYRSLKDRLGLEELEGTNAEIYKRLVDIEDEVAYELSEELNIDEENAAKVLESDNSDYLMEKLDQRKRRDLKESFEDVKEELDEDLGRGISEAGMSLVGQIKRAYRLARGREIDKDEFIEVFSGERPEEFLVAPDFEKTVYIDPDGEVSTDAEEVKNESYRQGLELLDDLSRNERSFKTSEYDFAEHVLEEKAEVKENLEDLREGLESGEFNYSDIEDEMQEINDEVEEKEKEYHEQYIHEWFQHLSADLTPLEEADDPEDADIPPGDLEHALRQANQHLFKKRSSAYNKAKDVVSGLETADADISEGEVRVGVYDKTIDSDMPYKDESRCCAFPGGVADDLLIDYMTDPSTQILEIEKGDDKGYAIGYEVKTLSEENFFVETVETAGNMFRDETVVETVAEIINDYTADAGYDNVVFNRNASNSAPQEFSENLDEMEGFESETVLGRKPGKTLYNESLPPASIISPVEIPVYQGHTAK
jgi:hypothetical protein